MAYTSNNQFTIEDTITVEVDGVDVEIEVTCEFDYTPAERGSWSGGQQMEPDYGAEVELLSVKDGKGVDWIDRIGDADKDRAMTKALEYADSPDDDVDYYPDDDADWDRYIGPD